MIKFTNSSLPKILHITDSEEVCDIRTTSNKDFISTEFDVIKYIIPAYIQYDNTNVINNHIYDILSNNQIDAIVTQSINGWERFTILNDMLPEYMKYMWYHFDDYDNHGDEIYNSIINKQLSGHSIHPMFSFFTPLYNTNIKYFEECYYSLKAQKCNNWEWVIYDDSPIELEYIQELILKYQDLRIRYIRYNDISNGNIGLSKWRACSNTRGSWLIELDHDDYLPEFALDYVIKAICEYPENDFIYSDYANVDKDRNFIYNMYGESYAFGHGKPYLFATTAEYNEPRIIPSDMSPNINDLTARHIVGMPNHLRCWSRKLYFGIGGHNQLMRIADDYELCVKTFLHTKFTRITAPCYYQRFDGNNSQDANGDMNRKDIQRRVEYIANFYNKDISNKITNELGEYDPNDYDGCLPYVNNILMISE